MKKIQIEKTLFGNTITATVIPLDYGYEVTVFGGTKTHIGATTMTDTSGTPVSVSFSGHKEQIVTETWSRAFFDRFPEPNCVTAGIHYDNLSPEQIQIILRETDGMLAELLDRVQFAVTR